MIAPGIAMLLPGRLSASTLGDLLGLLHRDRTTGQLELRELRVGARGVPGREHRVHLFDGLVVAVESGLPVRPLGEILSRRGAAGAEVIDRLLRHRAPGETRAAGEILVGAGIVRHEAVTGALLAQLRERVDALFDLQDAAIRFRPPRPLPPSARRTGPLAPADFLHGRPRGRDHRSGTRAPDASRAAPGRPDEARSRALHALGLLPGATEASVRHAFRRLASELHPDRNAGARPEERTGHLRRFAELSAAYHLLVA